MNQLTESIVTILVAVIGLATVAVLVGRYAKTSQVIDSGGKAFSNILSVAVSPVSGGNGYNPYGGGLMG